MGTRELKTLEHVVGSIEGLLKMMTRITSKFEEVDARLALLESGGVAGKGGQDAG